MFKITHFVRKIQIYHVFVFLRAQQLFDIMQNEIS